MGITDSDAPESTATATFFQLFVTELTAPGSLTVVNPLMAFAPGYIPAHPICLAPAVNISASLVANSSSFL